MGLSMEFGCFLSMVQLFEYVLEYLRGQCHKEMDDFQLPTDLNTLKALRREAEFYQLPGLVSRLTKAIEVCCLL